MSGVQTLRVEPSEDGSRLDRWFKRRFPHVSAIMVQKLCRKGQIRVDGGRVKGDSRVTAGQEIRIPPLPEPSERKPRPRLSDEDIDFVRSLVIYEDAELIAFNKPAGLAVQGGSKTTRHLDGLLDAFGEGLERPRLVHRLDKDTSGVVIVGKGPKATAKLAKAFQSHKTKKTYWAIALGVPKPKMGESKIGMRFNRMPIVRLCLLMGFEGLVCSSEQKMGLRIFGVYLQRMDKVFLRFLVVFFD